MMSSNNRRSLLGMAAVMGLGLLAMSVRPAAADPPSKAPAWGWRSKQSSYQNRGGYRSGNDRYGSSYRRDWDNRNRRRSASDIDGDGISNWRDSDRDGDGVVNSRDRDIDGDGIPNSRDRNDAARGQGSRGNGYYGNSRYDGNNVYYGNNGYYDNNRYYGSSRTHRHRHGDADRDGVRNRRDRDIDGDGRRNWRDRDMDGDNRRNGRDRYDLNPRRR